MKVTSILISEITIPKGRQRSRLVGIPDLACSLKEHGIINPITLTHGKVLVSGERRLAAAKSIGWLSIPCHVLSKAPPEKLLRIELEENVQRADLPWQDRCRAMLAVTELLKGDGLTQAAVAERLSITPPYLSKVLTVARELGTNEALRDAPNLKAAADTIARRKARRVASEMESFVQPEEEEVQGARIIEAEFAEWAKGYRGERFNLIWCDDIVPRTEHSPDWHALMDNRQMLIAASAHVVVWFDMRNYAVSLSTMDMVLPEISWNPAPFIWHRSRTQGIALGQGQHPNRSYEAAFLGTKGHRPLVKALPDCVSIGPTKKGRPDAVTRHFLRMLVDNTTRLLVPMCGEGEVVSIASKLGAKCAVGVESSPVAVLLARQAL